MTSVAVHLPKKLLKWTPVTRKSPVRAPYFPGVEMPSTPYNHGLCYRSDNTPPVMLNTLGDVYHPSLPSFKGMKRLEQTPLKLNYSQPPVDKIPTLKHNLNSVLKSRGVHLTRHKPSGVHILPEEVATLHSPTIINYNAMPAFIPSSKDTVLIKMLYSPSELLPRVGMLHQLAKSHGASYKGSTSSVSSSLCHLYFLMSNFRPVCMHNYSSRIRNQTPTYTPAARQASVIQLIPDDGLWSINRLTPKKDSVLADIGKSYERMITMGRDQFENVFLKSNIANVDNSIVEPDVYRFLQAGPFYLRSQLDCYDPDAGIFDLKSRAVQPLRYSKQTHENVDYEIENLSGTFRSFEVEFYDLARSSLLRNWFQVCIGNMSGIFIAYHNTKDVFGYEFINQDEMEMTLFQSRRMAEVSFDTTLKLFDHVLQAVCNIFGPSQPIQMMMKSEYSVQGGSVATIFVEQTEPAFNLPETLTPRDRKKPLYAFTLRCRATLFDRVVNGAVSILDDSDVKFLYSLEPLKLTQHRLDNLYDTMMAELYGVKDRRPPPFPLMEGL